MGSMGGKMFKSTRPEMCTKLNSADDDKIKDHAEIVKDVNQECPVDKSARVRDLKEVCSSSHCLVPTRPRTPRVCIGVVTSDFEGVDYFRGAEEVVVEENGLGKSEKGSRDENGDGCLDGSEEPSLRKKVQQDCIVSEYYCSADQVITDEIGSRKSRKRPRDEDYGVCDDGSEDCVVSGESSKKKRREYVASDADYVKESSKKAEQDCYGSDEDYREESSKKRKQKRVEKKRTVPRKAVQVHNLQTDLPRNLQEYINGLDLEAPPLFVARKVLTATDVDSHQSRLLLPSSLINAEFFNNFLTEGEKKMLAMEAVEVNVVDDKLRESYGLRLAKWKMTSSLEYALRRGWNAVVEENNLEPLKLSKDTRDRIVVMKDGDLWKTDVVVLAWCFRKESEIWLALHTQAMTEVEILSIGENSEGKRYIIS